MTFIFPDAVRDVLQACAHFRSRRIGIELLQSEIAKGEQAIVAHEERILRGVLKKAESGLEILRFTEDDSYSLGLRVVDAVEHAFREWQAGDDSSLNGGPGAIPNH